jgi:hypothetical protein
MNIFQRLCLRFNRVQSYEVKVPDNAPKVNSSAMEMKQKSYKKARDICLDEASRIMNQDQHDFQYFVYFLRKQIYK